MKLTVPVDTLVSFSPLVAAVLLRAGMVCLALLACPFQSASEGENRLLDPLAETKTGRIEKFVAADAFRIGNRIGGRTLGAVGLSFTRHFLGVIESDAPVTSLRGFELRYTAGDKSLINALGGEEGAAVSFLAHAHYIMEMGNEGPGHTDWRSNFAYVRSPVDQKLWAVHWFVNYANEWTIGAVTVPHPDLDWRAGSRLFSRRALPGVLSCADGADAMMACDGGMVGYQ